MGQLYLHFMRPMQEVVSHYVHDADAVADIVHDGFIVAFMSIDSLKDCDKLKSWLTTIMRNLALKYLQSDWAKSRELSDDDTAHDVAVTEYTEDVTVEDILRIIDTLPEGYGNVFRLAVLDGLSHKDIGRLLGIAHTSSASQLYHAKAMLRRLITNRRVQIGVLAMVACIPALWRVMHKGAEDTVTQPDVAQLPTVAEIASDSIATPSMHRAVNVHKGLTASAPTSSESIPDAQPTIAPTAESDSVVASTTAEWIAEQTDDCHDPDFEQIIPAKAAGRGWQMSMSCSDGSRNFGSVGYNGGGDNLSGANNDTNGVDGLTTSETRHYRPMSVGIDLSKPITSRMSLVTGVRLTYLRSDFNLSNTTFLCQSIQRIYYLGIPLKLNFTLINYSNMSLYGQGGVCLDMPFDARQSSTVQFAREHTVQRYTAPVNAPVQWSAEGGIGLQYSLTPQWSIYTEPSIRYFLNSSGEVKTVRTDTPFEFTLPVGLRYKF